ncbi:hypothetical protein [Vulgatibacter sp.]|uniref:hypothetical protein n=1 Tax=Vulgatibacter sp. TaxID=1971226 RepID=UPI00356A86FA
MSKAAAAPSPKCATCGAPVAWDAGLGALACAYCGSSSAVEAVGSVVEHGLARAATYRAARLRVRRVGCTGCGAQVDFEPGIIASRCAFCGSHEIVVQDAEAAAPESVLPFAVPRTEADEAFRRWLKGLWFRPNDLKRMAKLKELRGVYLPFWTFDATADSRWTAMAGYHYWVTQSYTVSVNGRSQRLYRQVQRTRWEPATGQRRDRHDDHLVYASRGLPLHLVRNVEPFDTTKLQPFTTAFLAGWGAEEAAFGAEQGWEVGQHQLQEEQKKRCAGDVPGNTHRDLRVQTDFSAVTFKPTLLPIYVAAYAYRDEIYRFLVNGQTGKVSGDAPWSWVKITLAVIFALLLLGGVWAAEGR